MLTALELAGFKSFAEKTQFAFPPGVTVVVGPNGSGKSNIVDAIKWVLGEQSVKSLRGKEMADVIFNGSSSRKAVNAAEATLTFDNRDRRLEIDTDQVHITRRVYRSGEGEYLINRQPSRLRDIRDLFAGMGLSSEAYSIIEQGKVDVMLQASPRDRRLIFEEAAGISRFKAKKLEATRRLERVDQNLLRLSDIVEEVDSRLRSVRKQAAKARRYKEYTDRLQDLRTQVGLSDWRSLSERIAALDEELSTLGEEAAAETAKVERAELEIIGLDTKLAGAEEGIRQCEARVARNREQIASHQSTVDHGRARERDLEDELGRHRRHLTAVVGKTGNLDEQLRETNATLAEATAEHETVAARLHSQQATLEQLSADASAISNRVEALREEQLTAMRQAATLGNGASALESQITSLGRDCQQRGRQIEQLDASRGELETRHAELQTRQQTLADDLKSCEAQVQSLEDAHEATRERLGTEQKQLAQLESRVTGVTERVAILEELEARLEGIGAGAKQVLLQARKSSGGPFAEVRGLVADLFEASVESAPLIEAALGSFAQHVVLARSEPLLSAIRDGSVRLEGQVGFLRLDVQPPQHPAERVALAGQPGVVGRADDLVETPPEFIPLARRLLGRTWIVENLDVALALSSSAGRGVNLVTRAGELVTTEGAVTLGPRVNAGGLISRRSELRELQKTALELAEQRTRSQEAVARLEDEVARQQTQLRGSQQRRQALAEKLSEQRLHTQTAQQRLTEVAQRLAALREEQQAAEAQHRSATEQLEQTQTEIAQLDEQLEQLEGRLRQATEKLAAASKEKDALARKVTQDEVQLATSRQRLDGLRKHAERLARDQEERSRSLTESRQHLEECQQRLDDSRRAILQSTSRLAELFLDKQTLIADVGRAFAEREEQRRLRTAHTADAQQSRQRLHGLEESIHEKELAVGELKHQRTTLAERLRDDYGIELGELEHEPSDEELAEREEVDQEIAELRRKINNIGNVNLEALSELEDLEARFGSLSAQYDDLTKAKGSLEQIIGKINADSRRLFSETLETVREHFRTLFRKLFGGGQADIVLDETEDLLECGIEIVARPPGKEPRNISLLSGGEKTLTCVALLLAIFRSRPSPFCILDEVDAALDEPNIERFVGVVKEFLEWTQFVVVTHSKKTMTCADTLYGVTMQESGVSKRVAVRFDDVSEGGHIDQSALDREPEIDEPTEAAAEDETQAA